MMNSHELFGADMLKAFDAATAPVNEAGILPPILYTSNEFYEFENDSIFAKDWLCVGRTVQVPNPGDWYQFTPDGRTLTGRSRPGWAGACSLGSPASIAVWLSPKAVVTVYKFLCPYHHWSYALDGRLLGMPEMDQAVGFDKTQYNLPSLPTEILERVYFLPLYGRGRCTRAKFTSTHGVVVSL